jgi:tetratricopeptide (TPR) repeat protein
LDLETTGLAGGAGTQAFLVGCACLDRDGFSVRQFLLPGYEHERALLAEVSAWAAERGAIVTFNGRSFDVPLIETRYLFHRQPFPLEGRAHVDMLHPARRLWRARGEWEGSSEASCSLGTLEKLLAGVHRVGDVPGFEIPSRYFRFVRDGDARPLEAVLEHNRLDLVSLALVMARALTLVERGPSAAQSAYECLGLARVYDRAGRHDEAEASYLQAVDRLGRVGRDPETLADALRRLAWCRRRTGRWRDAAEAWQRLADLPRCPAPLRHEAREALAIYHEHRARNLDVAHAHARQLITGPANARQQEAAEHRLRRIERKLARKTRGSSLWPEPEDFESEAWSLDPEA